MSTSKERSGRGASGRSSKATAGRRAAKPKGTETDAIRKARLCATPEHFVLAVRGVGADVARARGYAVVRSAQELRDLGFAEVQCRAPALVIPIHSVVPDEGVVAHQLRPRRPRSRVAGTGGRTTPVKYEWPIGQSLRIDSHPFVKPCLGDVSESLWITEGVLKADAAVTAGVCCIALNGVDCWQQDGKPLPDWEHIALRGRDVFIVFDSDVMVKEEVQRALRDLTLFLLASSAHVHWKFLPERLGALTKVGVDDFLARPSELTELTKLPERTPTIADLEWEAVEKRAHLLRIQRAATLKVEHEEAASTFRLAPSRVTLREELELAEETLPYTIQALHPTGSNTLLTAQFKVGKTTLLSNIMWCLLDQMPFLGRYEVSKPLGRVAYWNYELSERQFRTWLRSLGIVNLDGGAVWNLRGHRLPLQVPFVEDEAVQWLRDREVTALIVDPFARAYGGDENSNFEVGKFLEALDVIKRRAGVEDLFIAAHTPRMAQAPGTERARGAARLDDWADARWILTKENERRYFYAEGRDVQVAEQGLDYDNETRRLTTVSGSRTEDHLSQKVEKALQVAVEVVANNDGITATELRKKMTGDSTHHNDGVRAAIERGLISETPDGKAKRYSLVAQPKVSLPKADGDTGDD